MNAHGAAEVSHALVHTSHSDAGCGDNNEWLSAQPVRESATLVLDDQLHVIGTSGQPDGYAFALRMPLSVRQCFLHDAKYRRFHRFWKPANVRPSLEGNANRRAILETSNVPLQAGNQA